MIRRALPADGAALSAIYAPFVRDTAVSFENDPPAAETMAGRVASTLPTHPYLVAERDGAVVGYAYASRHRERAAYRWSVDVTVYVDRDALRTGVGKALYRPLIDILKAQGFHAAFAGIALPNAGSVGLHEALGFKPVGIYPKVGFKLGKWHSVGWWGLTLNDSVGEPREIIPFAEINLALYL